MDVYGCFMLFMWFLHPAFLRSLAAPLLGASQDTVARRDPPKPTSQDVAQMSQHRCNVQALVDAMVNAVMRGHHGDAAQGPGKGGMF